MIVKLQSFYLNKQKMQSIHEFIQQVQMESARERVGGEPIHFLPKVQMDEIEIEDGLDFCERGSSFHDLPKFASAKLHPETTEARNELEVSHQIFSHVFHNMNETITVYAQRPKNSKITSFLIFIIWIAYALGTSQSSMEINYFNVIDFGGMALALGLTLYSIFIQKQSIQFHHFLHFFGIVITITLVAYSGEPGDSFSYALRIIRTFRLFFIINTNYSFTDLTLMYFHKIFRMVKVALPWLFIMLLFSVILHQSASYQFYNRCSEVVQNSILPNVSQDYLCGSKTCENGTICANPLSFDLIPDSRMYSNSSSLAFGYFQYGNLMQSYFTVISTAFLSNASKITNIFSNSSPILLIAFVNVLLIIFSQLFGSSMFLILSQEYFFEKIAHNEDTNAEQTTSKVRGTNISGMSGNGDLNSLVAPTFGPNSSKSIENKLKKTTQEYNKNGQDAINPAPLGTKSIKLIKIESTKTVKIEQSCYQKYLPIVTAIFLILVSLAHFGLALAFALGNQEEMQRLLGVCLIVIFIVWSTWVAMKLSGVMQNQQQQNKKSKELITNENTIFSIEIAIYCIHFVDYIARILKGGYVLEQPSPLTPLSTSLLMLRIIYLPIAFESVVLQSHLWKKINKNFNIYKELVSNMLPFLSLLAACSLALATISTQINGQGYFSQVLKHIKTLLNLNWLEHYNNSSSQSFFDSSSGWGIPFKMIIILIGQLILLKIVFADSIILAFVRFLKLKDYELYKSEKQILDQTEKNKMIRSQKSLFIIPYDFLCIRSTIDSLFQTENYRNGRQKIVTIYVFALVIGQTLFKGMAIYEYLILVGDFILLIDAFLRMVAYRFWGEGSLVDKKWYNLVNFLVSIIVVANLASPMFDVFFLRVLRVFLLLQFCPQLTEAYHKIFSLMMVMSNALSVVFIVWIMVTLMVGIMLANTSNYDVLTIVFSSFNFSLRLMEKGYDFPSSINFSSENDIQFYSNYNSIIYLLARIPLESILIGVGIAYFQISKQEKQQEEVMKLALQQPNLLDLTAKEDYQVSQIKKKILGFSPVYDAIHGLERNIIRDILQEHQYFFNYFKNTVILIDFLLLLCLPLIAQYVTSHQLLQVKLARHSFYILQLLTFIFQSFVYRGCNSNFKLKLLLYLFSFPGSFLMMIPMHKVEASSQLTNLFQFLLMLTPLPAVQIYFVASNKIMRIIRYVFSRLSLTIWMSIWILITVIFFSGALVLIVDQSFPYLFSMVFIGIFGSSYEATLQKNPISSVVALYIIEICIFWTGLALRSALIASFIFQCVDKIRNYDYSKTQAGQIKRSDFNKIFNEEKFSNIWNRLDKKAVGLLPFKTILNHLFQFVSCFNLHQLYIEYAIKPKHETFAQRLQLFKRLHLPVRSVSLTHRSDDDRSSQYMIAVYDLIARLYCLALEENIHKISYINGMQEIKEYSHTYKNWSKKIGFDTEEWSKTLSEKLNTDNYKKWNQQQLEEKHFVPNEIQTDSWRLGFVVSLFPTIRRRLSSIKQKVK